MSVEQFGEFLHEHTGPRFSAFIASILVAGLVKKWSKWIPVKVGKKGRSQLLEDHKITLRVAKAISIAGLLFVLFLCNCGRLNNHDLRGVGLALGIIAVSPISCILVANASRGIERIKEGMVALAISEKAPISVIFSLLAICFVAGVVSAVSLLLER
jgi:hypothetical protein